MLTSNALCFFGLVVEFVPEPILRSRDSRDARAADGGQDPRVSRCMRLVQYDFWVAEPARPGYGFVPLGTFLVWMEQTAE